MNGKDLKLTVMNVTVTYNYYQKNAINNYNKGHIFIKKILFGNQNNVKIIC